MPGPTSTQSLDAKIDAPALGFPYSVRRTLRRVSAVTQACRFATQLVTLTRFFPPKSAKAPNTWAARSLSPRTLAFLRTAIRAGSAGFLSAFERSQHRAERRATAPVRGLRRYLPAPAALVRGRRSVDSAAAAASFPPPTMRNSSGPWTQTFHCVTWLHNSPLHHHSTLPPGLPPKPVHC